MKGTYKPEWNLLSPAAYLSKDVAKCPAASGGQMLPLPCLAVDIEVMFSSSATTQAKLVLRHPKHAVKALLTELDIALETVLLDEDSIDGRRQCRLLGYWEDYLPKFSPNSRNGEEDTLFNTLQYNITDYWQELITKNFERRETQELATFRALNDAPSVSLCKRLQRYS